MAPPTPRPRAQRQQQPRQGSVRGKKEQAGPVGRRRRIVRARRPPQSIDTSNGETPFFSSGVATNAEATTGSYNEAVAAAAAVVHANKNAEGDRMSRATDNNNSCRTNAGLPAERPAAARARSSSWDGKIERGDELVPTDVFIGGGWQSDKHTLDRKRMIVKIDLLLHQSKGQNPPREWIDAIPQTAKLLEEYLYRFAPSFEEYNDVTTLQQRLMPLGDVLSPPTQQAVQNAAAVGRETGVAEGIKLYVGNLDYGELLFLV